MTDATHRHVIVFDLESTCWERQRPLPEREIIEIGAVRLDARGAEVDSFQEFVRPVRSPELSEYCRALTSISQADVVAADGYADVWERFRGWVEAGECAGLGTPTLASWGSYDLQHLRSDCALAGIEFPAEFEAAHLNLKTTFAAHVSKRPRGMAAALEHLGLPLGGTHHRALDDARNIAAIARRVLKFADATEG